MSISEGKRVLLLGMGSFSVSLGRLEGTSYNLVCVCVCVCVCVNHTNVMKATGEKEDKSRVLCG